MASPVTANVSVKREKLLRCLAEKAKQNIAAKEADSLQVAVAKEKFEGISKNGTIGLIISVRM